MTAPEHEGRGTGRRHGAQGAGAEGLRGYGQLANARQD